MFGAVKLGLRCRWLRPGYEPNQLIVKSAAREAQKGRTPAPEVMSDPREAVKGADAVYTDVWTSMGQEAESEARNAAFDGYIVDQALMSEAKPGAVFMHVFRPTAGGGCGGRDGWAAVDRLRRGREPPARAEGADVLLMGPPA